MRQSSVAQIGGYFAWAGGLERQSVGGFGNGASSITRSKPGEAIRAEIAKRGYEAAAVLIPGSSPVLACDVLAAPLVAAGHDGEWHQDWADAATALQARLESETAKRMALLKIAGRRSSSAIQHCLLGELGGADPTGPS